MEKSGGSAPLRDGESTIQYGGIPMARSISDDEGRVSCLRIVKSLTIEPLMFAFMCAFMLTTSSLPNMMMIKACLYHLNYSAEVCHNLTEYEDQRHSSAKLANSYTMYCNLLALVAAFAMVFIAPWSDKYGRKPPLIMAVCGNLVGDIGHMLCVIYFDSRLEYLILARLPAELFGGFICVLTIIYSMASETSSDKTRTLKYTFVQIALGLGMSLGMLFGGLIYKFYGFFYVYTMAFALHLFCLFWALCIIEETTGLDSTVSRQQKLKEFFSFKRLKEGIKTCIKVRPNNQRMELWLLFGSMCAIVITYESFGSISFVFANDSFKWDQTLFNIVVFAFSFSSLVTVLLSVPVFVRIYKLRDTTIGIIGAISMLVKNTLIAFSKYHVWIYYLGNVSGIFTGLSTLGVRSRISKFIGKDELGQVFSVLATFESLVPILGTVIITNIFNATMKIFPCLGYLVTSFFLLLPLATFTWQHFRTEEFSPLVEDSPSDKKGAV